MSYSNQSTVLAETIVDEIVRSGIGSVVIAPGSRSAPLAIAMARCNDLIVHVEIDERSAGFFALGLAKTTGKPAAVLVTSGSAVANLHPAVVEADASGTPMLLLTADRPPELHDVSANQTIDQTALFGPQVRWRAVIGPDEHRPMVTQSWRSIVDRAIAEAIGWRERPGPVHLDIAFREPLVPQVDDGRTAGDFDNEVPARADGSAWHRVRKLLPVVTELDPRWSDVERGLVLAGSADIPVAGSASRLAARLGWPLIIEPSAGGRPAQAISTAHHLCQVGRLAEVLTPEVVVRVGAVGLSRPVASLVEDVPTVVAMGWNDPGRDAVEIHPGLVDVRTPPTRDGEWRRTWLELERIARSTLDDAIDRLDEMSEARVSRDLGRFIPEDGVLVVGSSMPIRDLDRYSGVFGAPIIANRGASGIDGIVSTTLGAAAARLGPTIALVGDLSFIHDINGFLVRPRPDAVFVVVDNDGGGIFSFLPQSAEEDVFEQVFGTPTGVDMDAVARSHQLGYQRVDRADDIGPTIRRALSDGGCQVVHIPVSRRSHVDIARRLSAAVTTDIDRVWEAR